MAKLKPVPLTSTVEKRKQGKPKVFNPSQNEIDSAMVVFLKNDGMIKELPSQIRLPSKMVGVRPPKFVYDE